MTPLRARIAAIAFSMAAALLAACSMVETVVSGDPFLDGSGTVAAPGCVSQLGAYRLPTGLVRLVATLTTNPGEALPILNLELQPVIVADRSQTLCLDYLASPTSKDVIGVQRDPNMLLKRVGSLAQDQTPEILKTVIATGAELAVAGGRSGTGEAGRTEWLDITFDPFGPAEMADAKRALRRLGLCLYVEGHSFAPPATPEKWCAAADVLQGSRAAEAARLPVDPAAYGRGVLYRPKMQHKIVVYRKADPTGVVPWRLYHTQRVELPNLAPILSIGVERAVFATRKTDLVFTDGVLTDVRIEKDSELFGFVSIPLGLAKAIVDVPARILKIRIGDTSQEALLLQSEIELIKATYAYENRVPTATADPGGVEARSGTFTGACLDANGPLDDCARAGRALRQ